MAKTIRLRAPKGTDEANFGTHLYRVNNDGTITVPQEAAEALMSKGGFVNDEPILEAPPEGMAIVRGPAYASFSFKNEQFSSDALGFVEVPLEAVPYLAAHGFTPVESR